MTDIRGEKKIQSRTHTLKKSDKVNLSYGRQTSRNDVKENNQQLQEKFPNYFSLTSEERSIFRDTLLTARRNIEQRQNVTIGGLGTIHDSFLEASDLENYETESADVGRIEKKHSQIKVSEPSKEKLHRQSGLKIPLDKKNRTRGKGQSIIKYPSRRKKIEKDCNHVPHIIKVVSTKKRSRMAIQNSFSGDRRVKYNKTTKKTGRRTTGRKYKNKSSDEKLKNTFIDGGDGSFQASKFGELSQEEKTIFFQTLQRAYNNILERDPQKKAQIIAYGDLVKMYSHMESSTSSYPLKGHDKEVRLRFGLKIESRDNERLETFGKDQTRVKKDSQIKQEKEHKKRRSIEEEESTSISSTSSSGDDSVFEGGKKTEKELTAETAIQVSESLFDESKYEKQLRKTDIGLQTSSIFKGGGILRHDGFKRQISSDSSSKTSKSSSSSSSEYELSNIPVSEGKELIKKLGDTSTENIKESDEGKPKDQRSEHEKKLYRENLEPVKKSDEEQIGGKKKLDVEKLEIEENVEDYEEEGGKEDDEEDDSDKEDEDDENDDDDDGEDEEEEEEEQEEAEVVREEYVPKVEKKDERVVSGLEAGTTAGATAKTDLRPGEKIKMGIITDKEKTLLNDDESDSQPKTYDPKSTVNEANDIKSEETALKHSMGFQKGKFSKGGDLRGITGLRDIYEDGEKIYQAKKPTTGLKKASLMKIASSTIDTTASPVNIRRKSGEKNQRGSQQGIPDTPKTVTALEPIVPRQKEDLENNKMEKISHKNTEVPAENIVKRRTSKSTGRSTTNLLTDSQASIMEEKKLSSKSLVNLYEKKLQTKTSDSNVPHADKVEKEKYKSYSEGERRTQSFQVDIQDHNRAVLLFPIKVKRNTKTHILMKMAFHTSPDK